MHVSKLSLKCAFSLLAGIVTLVPASAQRFDVTPLIAGRYGGTIKLEDQSQTSRVDGHLADSFGYGVAAGFRFDAEDCDSCGLFEFRWMRHDSHIDVNNQNPAVPTPVSANVLRPHVTLDHFMGDFTYEWQVPEAHAVKPFAMLSLGAMRMSTPASSATRFAFGISTGVKVFPKPNWGFRFQVEYLPVVMHADVQSVVCTGGCIVAIGGGLMNQFQMSFGPTFRF
jgi:hypothetical protein